MNEEELQGRILMYIFKKKIEFELNEEFEIQFLYNNDKIRKHYANMINLFKLVFEFVKNSKYKNNFVKKNIFEFTLEYMHLFFFETIYLYKIYKLLKDKENLIKKLEDDVGSEFFKTNFVHSTIVELLHETLRELAELKESYNKQKNFLIKSVQDTIINFKNEYLTLVDDSIIDCDMDDYVNLTNDQKNYCLTINIINVFNNFDENLYNKIYEMKRYVFGRNDMYYCQNDQKNEKDYYFRNFNIDSLNTNQIKELLDFIGPEKSFRTHEKIVENIENQEKKIDIQQYIFDNFSIFINNKTDTSFIDAIVGRLTDLKPILIQKIKRIYINIICNEEIKKYKFESELKFRQIKIEQSINNIVKLKLISEFKEDFLYKEQFLEQLNLLIDVDTMDDDELLKYINEGDAPPKGKKKKSKKSKQGKGEEVNDDIIDSKFVTTDIDLSKIKIDEKIKDLILANVTEENVNNIRKTFFYEDGIKFSNNHFGESLIPKKLYYSIIFEFMKDYLLLIIGSIVQNQPILKDGFNVILTGGACVQYFSEGKRKTSDLDFMICSKKDIKDIKSIIEKFLLPYLLSPEIMNIKNILKSREYSAEKEIEDFKLENLNNFYKILIKEITKIELKCKYDDVRNIIKLDLYVNGEKGGSLIDMIFYNLKDSDIKDRITKFKLNKNNTIKIINKEFLLSQMSGYKSDYDTFISLTDEDKKEFKPKYIKQVPGINLDETINFIGNKAINQINAIKSAEEKGGKGDSGRFKRSIRRKRSNKRMSTSIRRKRSNKRMSTRSIRKRSNKRTLN
jgi:hypothetical protein